MFVSVVVHQYLYVVRIHVETTDNVLMLLPPLKDIFVLVKKATDISGHDCENEPGVCSIVQPCTNGGTCIGSKEDYSCTCPLSFEGHHCEHGLVQESSSKVAETEEGDARGVLW